MSSKIDAMALADTDAEDDERYNCDLIWTKNRKFLKQLVKDNIDVSLFENEISRGAQNHPNKSWKEYFLSCIRSHMFQLIISFLVLLDAGIVISEIVLEIQSLQSYKNNFRNQLGEARRILCNVMYISSTTGQRHPKCPVDSHATPHAQNQSHPEPGSVKSDINAHQIQGQAQGHHKLESSEHSESDDHGGVDMELPNSMQTLIEHWYAVYDQRLTCVVEQTSPDIPLKALQDEAASKLHPVHNASLISHKIPPTSINFTQSENTTVQHIPPIRTVYPEPITVAQTRDQAIGAQTMHEASEILHYLSIAITGLFLFCVMFKLVCLGRKFFREANEYFDGGIIVASFITDVLYVRYVSDTAAAMVILLLWRIVRIINALMMHKQQQYELRIALQKRARRVMGRKMEIIRTEKEMQDKHISALEDLLRDLGSTNETIRKCKPRYKKCTKEQTNNALKSIAALTTGVMGGLVGAPSNIQGVLSRFGGGTGMNTPTASQKSLQQMLMGPTNSSCNLTGERPSLIKGSYTSPESNSQPDDVDGRMAKSTSTNFDQSIMFQSPSGTRARTLKSPERGNRNGKEPNMFLRSLFMRGASYDGETPPTSARCFRNQSPVQPLEGSPLWISRTGTNSGKLSRQTTVGEPLTESAIEMNNTEQTMEEPTKQNRSPSSDGYQTIQDLFYPRRRFYMERIRKIGARDVPSNSRKNSRSKPSLHTEIDRPVAKGNPKCSRGSKRRLLHLFSSSTARSASSELIPVASHRNHVNSNSHSSDLQSPIVTTLTDSGRQYSLEYSDRRDDPDEAMQESGSIQQDISHEAANLYENELQSGADVHLIITIGDVCSDSNTIENPALFSSSSITKLSDPPSSPQLMDSGQPSSTR